MTINVLVKQIQADGIRLSKTERGTIKVAGKSENISRWIPAIKEHKPEILDELSKPRWNPELATQEYVWCLDCVHWQDVTQTGAAHWSKADDTHICAHTDNPFRSQQPLAPRMCRWFAVSAVHDNQQQASANDK